MKTKENDLNHVSLIVHSTMFEKSKTTPWAEVDSCRRAATSADH